MEKVKEVQGDNELAGQTSQDEELTMDQVPCSFIIPASYLYQD